MKRVIALGFFDGVHIGHGALFRRAAEMARELEATPAAVTFDVPPAKRMGGQPVPLLSSLDVRRELMEELYGVEMLTLIFDDELRQLPWDDFITEVLIREYDAVGVVCGRDYRFGWKGAGTSAMLQEKCAQLGLACQVIDKIALSGTTVSSTYIRGLVTEGNVREARRFLGHPYMLSGTVEHGKRLGRRIGIPTTNLTPSEGLLLPPFGVYTTVARLESGARYPAVTNIGVRPTVDDSARVSIESWLLDFDGDLYGQHLRVELYDYLRPERKFSSLEELVREIHRDRDVVRSWIERHPEFLEG
ncbi:MAG: riboflavin biosynthesis protein RibF [Oscillospiraceae bacterium]|nr:riboflavin biosynthesis protein RibF [Oscillospiraceae bacterium]